MHVDEIGCTKCKDATNHAACHCRGGMVYRLSYPRICAPCCARQRHVLPIMGHGERVAKTGRGDTASIRILLLLLSPMSLLEETTVRTRQRNSFQSSPPSRQGPLFTWTVLSMLLRLRRQQFMLARSMMMRLLYSETITLFPSFKSLPTGVLSPTPPDSEHSIWL